MTNKVDVKISLTWGEMLALHYRFWCISNVEAFKCIQFWLGKRNHTWMGVTNICSYVPLCASVCLLILRKILRDNIKKATQLSPQQQEPGAQQQPEPQTASGQQRSCEACCLSRQDQASWQQLLHFPVCIIWNSDRTRSNWISPKFTNWQFMLLLPMFQKISLLMQRSETMFSSFCSPSGLWHHFSC